ncbi:hypothetical protein [Actinospica sp.]|uniref:hypothetical protein n=1 Tax=Actinospica sp. TaxID=1872142 RepID=UPI0032C24826
MITYSTEAVRLTREGIPSPADHRAMLYGREPKGSIWRPATLKGILTSEAALGYLMHDDRPVLGADGRPIRIADPLWDQTTRAALIAKTAPKRGGKPRAPKSTAMLLGIAFCGQCGHRLYLTFADQQHVQRYELRVSRAHEGHPFGGPLQASPDDDSRQAEQAGGDQVPRGRRRAAALASSAPRGHGPRRPPATSTRSGQASNILSTHSRRGRLRRPRSPDRPGASRPSCQAADSRTWPQPAAIRLQPGRVVSEADQFGCCGEDRARRRSPRRRARAATSARALRMRR